MLPPFADYCEFITGLPDKYPFIQSSTLIVYTIGPFTAEVTGQLIFADEYIFEIWELLDLATQTIRSYSYELSRAGERLWWYDPMAHPQDPELQSSYPHHQHIQPDIKHHRVPAPQISFTAPNLPFLLQEIESLLKID